MKVSRRQKAEVERFEVGDRIKVKLPGAKYTATAVRQENDGMLFVFDQFFDGAMPMNTDGGTEGGYEASDMRKYLQKVAETLPGKIAKLIVPFENGDKLRLLTITEVCGVDANFNECEGQIPYFKDRRHRIASRKGDEYEWMWTATAVSAAYFALVYDNGGARYLGAGDARGVRPAFKISNP